ncbi:unnamed protein product [Rotaria socialis]|uniref:Uncharacterized protein n=1 Tax=Rotaria socialis TaxID=392032 RepID=A0A821GX07_9BILA|nr:unnamed protein product [Rotaria socialis]
MSTPLTPPATPYCILTDRHLQKYFTRDRIRQYLRRASLINKSGHILTEAEYENRLKNMEIGHTNQVKFEEALLEVIIELGEKQYESLCDVNGKRQKTIAKSIWTNRTTTKECSRKKQKRSD